jgi:hypothetical protein
MKPLNEFEEINEAKKTTVYVVVEDGDSAQYILDDMKIFFNEKDAQKYADSQKYGGFSVIKEEVI